MGLLRSCVQHSRLTRADVGGRGGAGRNDPSRHGLGQNSDDAVERAVKTYGERVQVAELDGRQWQDDANGSVLGPQMNRLVDQQWLFACVV